MKTISDNFLKNDVTKISVKKDHHFSGKKDLKRPSLFTLYKQTKSSIDKCQDFATIQQNTGVSPSTIHKMIKRTSSIKQP